MENTWYIHNTETNEDLKGTFTCFDAHMRAEELNEECGKEIYVSKQL